MSWITGCFLIGSSLVLCVNFAKSEPVLYWTVNEVEGERSCLYSIKGAPSTWVPVLALDGEVIAEPLCVNKTLFKFGPVSADGQSTRDVFTFDLLGGGLTRFEAMHDGNVETFFGGATDLKDVAVDWINHNVYYTDPTTGIVLVSYKAGTSHFRILSDAVDVPRGIAVDATRGYVFWADSGSGTIQRMPLGGGRPSAVVQGLSVPTLLAVDVAARTVYWLDEAEGVIGAWVYNGSASDIQTVVISDDIVPGVFSGMEVYEDYILGLISDDTTVVIWHRVTGELVTTLTFDDVGDATQHGIAMALDTAVTTASPCDVVNGRCDHICIYEGRGVTRVCLCGLGYQLQADDQSCKSDPVLDDFLLLTDMGENRLYQLSLADGAVHGIPIKTTFNQRLEDVTYDPHNSMVYWVDTGNNTLRGTPLRGGSNQEQVVHVFPEGSLVEGLAYDPVSHSVYYTDVGRFHIGRVDVSTQPGSQTIVLQMSEDDYPLKIQLDTLARIMYWTNIGFPDSKIERARMLDGGDRTVIASSDLVVPSSLVLSPSGSKLYWNDERLNKVETSAADGSSRQTITSGQGLYNMALDDKYMYAVFSHEVTRYTIDDQTSWPLGPRLFSNIYGIHLYSSKEDGPVSAGSVCDMSGFHVLTLAVTTLATWRHSLS